VVAPSRALWIDSDLALASATRDVDDAWAIAAAVRGAGDRLVGVSSVFGNAAADAAFHSTKELLALLGRGDLPVVLGAAHEGQQVSRAADAIAALPEGTHVLALGPLTNIAAALARDPAVATRITVSVLGGNPSSRGRWPPLWPFEFNLAQDARASRDVFASGVSLRVFTLDVACALTIGFAGIRRIARAPGVGPQLSRASLRWLAYAPLRHRRLHFPLWDVVPVLDAVGLLGGVEEQRRWRVEGKGLLVADDAAPPVTWIARFDGRAAGERLERLLLAPA